jgi:hypothetical protein
LSVRAPRGNAGRFASGLPLEQQAHPFSGNVQLSS